MRDSVINVYLDNDVTVRVAPLLDIHGFEVVTTAQRNRRAAEDYEQLLFAAQRDWILVTPNSIRSWKLSPPPPISPLCSNAPLGIRRSGRVSDRHRDRTEIGVLGRQHVDLRRTDVLDERGLPLI